MSTDYIVSSLPALTFGAKAPITWARFAETVGSEEEAARLLAPFADLDTQLRNAVAESRTASQEHNRPTDGLSLYWKGRVAAAFAEKDIARRDEMLDRVWWDAAGELVPPSSPLGRGALAAYAVRLKIALKREKISAQEGQKAFDRLTHETRRVFS